MGTWPWRETWLWAHGLARKEGEILPQSEWRQGPLTLSWSLRAFRLWTAEAKPGYWAAETELWEGDNPGRAGSQEQKFKGHLGMTWFQLPSVLGRYFGKWSSRRTVWRTHILAVGWGWVIRLVPLGPHGRWQAGGEFSENTWMLWSKKAGGMLGRQEQQTSIPRGVSGKSCTIFKRQLEDQILSEVALDLHKWTSLPLLCAPTL